MTQKLVCCTFAKYFCLRFLTMYLSGNKDIGLFFVAGINYKKTDAAIRGQFAVGNDQYERILQKAGSLGLSELFILSTCNRTEIYGFAQDSSQLVDLLCSETEGDAKTFRQLAYIKSGILAIEHLFYVGSGLDSQILGDYEIIGQIKVAAKFSKKHKFIGAFLERLVNAVLQASKVIKNQTSLSGGTVSVSFAAVQYIKEKLKRVGGKRILLLGTGKIGRNTCKNLVDYLHAKNIVLINRTADKAEQLATELQLHHALVENLQQEIDHADIILVATNAQDPAILASSLEGKGQKLVIDLSIPCNVEPAAGLLENITLVNVDHLSKLKDETLQKREAEVPKVKGIINEQLEEFLEWHHNRRHVPVLRAVKHKLEEIHTDPFYLNKFFSVQQDENRQQDIQKVLNGMAVKMRSQNQYGCYYIEAINEFLTTG